VTVRGYFVFIPHSRGNVNLLFRNISECRTCRSLPPS
jgi:hypothetical protein